MNFSVTLVRTLNPILGIFLNKKIKNIKGLVTPGDMNGYDIDPSTNAIKKPLGDKTKFLMLIKEDETRLIINLDLFLGYTLSKEHFYSIAKDMEEKSQGNYTAPSPK